MPDSVHIQLADYFVRSLGMDEQTVAMTSEKIVLPGTSAVSLNKRFTTILMKQLQPVDVQTNMHQLQAASVGNRKLAQKLERRIVQAEIMKVRLEKGKFSFRLGQPIGSLTQRGTRGWGFAVRRRRWMYKGGFRVPGNIRRSFFRAGFSSRGRVNSVGQRGRRGFQGRGRGGSKKIPTKEELDKQLDDYMSMTKRRLDADLDAYMAMAGSDYME
ncbi:hypothetical protein UPYG_G00155200 [Umbra pygmaea]|uniref:Chromatin target of PRMT1 protein C-terminal domain-containing protein n=1 Tax=Umbra pygmaea TaxID=75934 RepID=A0ABD0WY06_UMBPY